MLQSKVNRVTQFQAKGMLERLCGDLDRFVSFPAILGV